MGRPAHHLIVGADHVHDVEAEQRDVRRLQHVAAGVEHHVRQFGARRRLRRLLAEPDQRILGELQPRQHADVLADLAELRDAGLAPLGGSLSFLHHREPRHGQQEARIDAVVAGLDALAARHAGLGPFLRFCRALAEAQDVEHAGHHRLGSASPRPAGAGDRAGLEAGAAFGAGVEHVVDAAGEGFFESGVLHGVRIAQNRLRHETETAFACAIALAALIIGRRQFHQLELKAGLQILDLRPRQPHRDPAEPGMLRGKLNRRLLRGGLHAPQQIVAVMQLCRIVRRFGRMDRRHLGAGGRKVADQRVDVGRSQFRSTSINRNIERRVICRWFKFDRLHRLIFLLRYAAATWCFN